MASSSQSSASARNGKSSFFMEIAAPLIALTIIAGFGGWFLGMALTPQTPGAPTQGLEGYDKHLEKGRPAKANVSDAVSARSRHDPSESLTLKLKELPPVVTNLGNPQTVWVRLQAAIVYDERSISNLDILVSQLRSDIVAFLRATSLASIQGADGLRRLHEELSDRASIRSEKQVKEFIIETIVVQ